MKNVIDKKIIEEIILIKNSEKDPQKKKGLEEAEFGFKKGLRSKEIQDKLKNLYYDKQFIAYICVASQLVEFKIKEIITQSQQLANLLNKTLKLNKNWEEKSLGSLIKTLETYCIEDTDLIKQLNYFKNLRNKAIHKLFDVRVEIEDVENEIEIKLTPSFSYYNNLIYPLEKYLYEINIKILEAQDQQGRLPQESKMFAEKFRRKIEELNPDFKNRDIEKNIKI